MMIQELVLKNSRLAMSSLLTHQNPKLKPAPDGAVTFYKLTVTLIHALRRVRYSLSKNSTNLKILAGIRSGKKVLAVSDIQSFKR